MLSINSSPQDTLEPQRSHEIMAIINASPDSFSSNSRTPTSPTTLSEQAKLWIHEGLAWLDVGGESTRPGSTEVPPAEEWSRVQPVLESLFQLPLGPCRISLDSRHITTWIRALETFPQIGMINCVTGPPRTAAELEELKKLKKKHPHICFMAMHLHGDSPKTMQNNPLTGDQVITQIEEFFKQSQKVLEKIGFKRHQIYLDPGIGFGKTLESNLRLLEHARHWKNAGLTVQRNDHSKSPLAYGLSRKSFLEKLTGIAGPALRDGPSQALEVIVMRAGAQLIRTHNPSPLLRYLRDFSAR